MKSKIGEKTTKPYKRGGRSFLKTYPGAVILAALVVLGGSGYGISKIMGTAGDKTVADNKEPTHEEEILPENNEDPKDKDTDEQNNDDVLVASLSNVICDNETQLILPLKANTAPVSMQDLQDAVDIQEMVGEVQSGDDGNNTDQTAGIEGAIPLEQNGQGNTATTTEATVADAKKEPEATAAETTKANAASLSGKAKDYKNSVNGDTIGWIKVPGTNIDYPVVQSTDNNYYVYKNYNKQYDKNGVIYADYECKFGSSLSTNTIIYGHNWSNVYSRKVADPSDIMFGQLPSFHTLSFAQQNPFIYFSTTEKDYVWQIFAVFYTEESFNYIEASPSKDYYKTMLSEALKRSIHNYNVNVTTSDDILTLSTCTRVYGQRSDQRFVVMAKRVKSGTASTTITSHPNFKVPQF